MIEWAPQEDRQASKGVQWSRRDSRPGGSQRTVGRSGLRSVAIAFLILCLTLGTATAAGYVAKDTVVIRSLRAVWSDVLEAVVGERSEPAVDSGSHPLENGPGQSEEAPGHDENGPGQSDEAPGHGEDGPGKSDEAPGHGK